LLAELGIFHFHDLAARSGGALRRHLHDLKQRAQDAARRGACAGDEAVRLVHGQHHGTVVIRLQNGFARFRELEAFAPAQRGETAGEIIEVFGFRRVDDANAFERNI